MIRTDIIENLIKVFKEHSTEFSEVKKSEEKINTFVQEKIRKYATKELLDLDKKEPQLFKYCPYQLSLTDLCGGVFGRGITYTITTEDSEFLPIVFRNYISDEDKAELKTLLQIHIENCKKLSEFIERVERLLNSPYLNTEILRKHLPELFNTENKPEK